MSGLESVTVSSGRTLAEVLRSHERWLEGVQTALRAILDRESLNGLALPALNLRDAVLRGAALLDSDLSGSDFSSAVIDAADFERAILTNSDFSGHRSPRLALHSRGCRPAC